jgi:hypothetical protein
MSSTSSGFWCSGPLGETDEKDCATAAARGDAVVLAVSLLRDDRGPVALLPVHVRFGLERGPPHA